MSGPFGSAFGGGGGGSDGDTYLDHAQTPSTFAGAALNIVRVNAGATAVEFVDETSDFLTQYALLAGRAGGSTYIGGNASGDDILIQSTSDPTKGLIAISSLTTGLIYDDVNKKLAIGIAAGDTLFHIHQSSAGAVSANANSVLTIESSGTTYIQILSPDVSDKALLFGNVTSNVHGSIVYLSTFDMHFRNDNNISRLIIATGGGIYTLNATGGSQGVDTINAKAVYDDSVLLTCYVFDAAVDGQIDELKWDNLVPDYESRDSRGAIISYTPRFHLDMRKFKARLGGPEDPLDIDKYAAHWKTKKHLTSYPNETGYSINVGRLDIGSWVQRGIESDEILAIHVETLNQTDKAQEIRILALEDAVGI